MNKYLRISVLASMASVALVVAETTEFRTPQRLTRGEMHWPLKPVEKSWWYDTMETEEREVNSWSVDVWAGYYGVSAGEAFFKPQGGITTDTAPLSTLWFGTDSFRGIDVLAATPSAQTLVTINPFLGFARISPTFSYSEQGAVFGLRTMRTFGCDDMWHSGVRISLPVKKIEIEQEANVAVEETLQDVVRQEIVNINNPSQIDFAYRLDFLTTLGVFAAPGPSNFVKVVQYGDGTGSIPNDTKVAGADMTSRDPANDTALGSCPDESTCFPSAYAIRANGNVVPNSDCCCASSALVGKMPTPPFYRDASQVTDFVRADGSGGNDGDALFFKLVGQDYKTGGLATDVDAQSSLFIVPRSTGSDATFQLTQDSQAIYNRVATIIEQQIEPLETASFFFSENGIDLFAHEHIVGVGDLTFEWYIGYGDRFDWYIDGIIGAIFPTGTDTCSAKQIFHKPTGNNKHYEIKVGLEGGYNWCDQFALRAEAFYGHAFSKTESRAIVFADPNAPTPTNSNCNSSCNGNGTNVDSCALFLRNIGSPICVDVAWDWFYGRLDLTVFHPYNSDLGLTFGYEFYWKSHDHFNRDCGSDNCNTVTTVTTTDLLGQTGNVDFNAMQRNSQVFSNKLYGEVFHRWNFFELFAGASQIVAGENVMKETEAHLGLRLYF